MAERPILFSAPMVRAILDRRKRQTRRLVRGFRDWEAPNPGAEWRLRSDGRAVIRGALYVQDVWQEGWIERACPFGVFGDMLWVRETWYDDYALRDSKPPPEAPDDYIYYRADGEANAFFEDLESFRWRPSIHMPRWASRLTLRVADVRIERLQDISEADAQAEGVTPVFERFPSLGRDQCLTSGERMADAPHRASFAILWDEINGNRATWKTNPWVWVISFERLNQPEESR